MRFLNLLETLFSDYFLAKTKTLQQIFGMPYRLVFNIRTVVQLDCRKQVQFLEYLEIVQWILSPDRTEDF